MEKLGETGVFGKSLTEFRYYPDRFEIAAYRSELILNNLCEGIALITKFLKERKLFDKIKLKFMKKDYNLLQPHWEKPK